MFMRRRKKSAHRNSLNGVVSLAKPPARRSPPAMLRKGSSDALQMQGEREMMMVDNVVPPLGAQNDRDQVVAEKVSNLLRTAPAQMLPLFLYLLHTDSDLGRPQAGDGNRSENGIAGKGRHASPLTLFNGMKI